MEKLSYTELTLLCDVTKDRIIRVDQLILDFSDIYHKTQAVMSLELVEAYRAEKLELDALLKKLKTMKEEI